MHTYLPAGVHVAEYTGGTIWKDCGAWFVRVSFRASDGTTGVHTFPVQVIL